MKGLKFVGSTYKDLCNFPAAARHDGGYQLERVQRGREPYDWKPMRTIGPGVREIRIHEHGEFRVIYTATIGGRVYALHAFQKKTQRTSKKDIDIARQRFKQVRGK